MLRASSFFGCELAPNFSPKLTISKITSTSLCRKSVFAEDLSAAKTGERLLLMAKKLKTKIPNTVPRGDHILDQLDLFTGKSLRDELAENDSEREGDDV